MNNISKRLFKIALIWLCVGVVLMWTLGNILGPGGGLDQIGDAITYAIMWQIVVYFPPAIMVFAGLLLHLQKAFPKLFEILTCIISSCLIVCILWNALGKRVLYTPTYLAKRTESYNEWLNTYRCPSYYSSKYDAVEQYFNEQNKKSLYKCSGWIDTEPEKRKYVEAIVEYRKGECGITDWEYISNLEDYLENTSPEGRIDILSSSAMHELEEKLNGHWDMIMYGELAHYPYIWIDKPLLVLYMEDGTLVPVGQYMLF